VEFMGRRHTESYKRNVLTADRYHVYLP